MKLQATNHDENLALIAYAVDALVNAKTDEVDLTLSNGYTIGIFVCDYESENRATATVAILRNHKDLNDSDFVGDRTREFSASEVRYLLTDISQAKTDFEVGVAYACYVARTRQ